MKRKRRLLCLGLVLSAAIVSVACLRTYLRSLKPAEELSSGDYYQTLPPGPDSQDALKWISEDFVTDPHFSGNLPLVVLQMDGPLPEYKYFKGGIEFVNEDVYPWVNGRMYLYENPSGENSLLDEPSLTSNITIKKRGNSSFVFDKSQYYIKTVSEDGMEQPVDVFGMGAGEAWVLNGSMADKSMMRNYLAYRVAASVMEYAPRCCYCEMFTLENGVYTYQGVYLMTEAVKQGANRVNISSSKRKNVYTSYLVRRDRYTESDTMLDTYGRLEDIDGEWIGVKYPASAKQTEANLAYIAEDFSNIERVLYSQDDVVFKTYDRYIDTDSFVDYFLINEYFGNYDAGEHSTYMYKDTGSRLKIGPVWDFDQAMSNSVNAEADPSTMAMQDRAFFRQLTRDHVFVNALIVRYNQLRQTILSDDSIFSMLCA